jgi:hypothetical protein
MDDHTGKHSATGLRTDVQRTTANIPTGRVEKLLFLYIFLVLADQTQQNGEETGENYSMARDQRKLFYDDDIISVFMSPLGKKSFHIVIPVKLLTP